MEEILASIRRIIADDDATKSTQHAAEAPKLAVPAGRPIAPARPQPAPARVAPPPPSPMEAAFEAEPGAMNSASVDDQSADILDLTESMAAPPAAAPRGRPEPPPQFRTINGESDVGFEDAAERAAPQGNVGGSSQSDVPRYQRCGRFGLQFAGANRAGAERPHARRSGARDVAAIAPGLDRREPAKHGRAAGAPGD